MFLLLRRHLPQPLHPLAGQLRLALCVYTGTSIRRRVRSLPGRDIPVHRRTIIIAVIAVWMLTALIRSARTSRSAVRMIRVASLISIWVRAGALRRMVLRTRRGMRGLHALLPVLRPCVHASSAVYAPPAVRPLRRCRLRAQQQQGREKQPHRQRE